MHKRGTPRKWKVVKKVKDSHGEAGWEAFADEMMVWLNFAHGNIEKELIVNRVRVMKKWITGGD